MRICVDVFGDSCRVEVTFTPSKLPEAEKNKPYSVHIDIRGGAMPNKSNLNYTIIPVNSGLDIRSIDEDGFYNKIELFGIPQVVGDVEIHFEGFVYSSVSASFDKTFILKVNPPVEQNIKD